MKKGRQEKRGRAQYRRLIVKKAHKGVGERKQKKEWAEGDVKDQTTNSAKKKKGKGIKGGEGRKRGK